MSGRRFRRPRFAPATAGSGIALPTRHAPPLRPDAARPPGLVGRARAAADQRQPVQGSRGRPRLADRQAERLRLPDRRPGPVRGDDPAARARPANVRGRVGGRALRRGGPVARGVRRGGRGGGARRAALAAVARPDRSAGAGRPAGHRLAAAPAAEARRTDETRSPAGWACSASGPGSCWARWPAWRRRLQPTYAHNPFLFNRTTTATDVRITWVLRKVDCNTTPDVLGAMLGPERPRRPARADVDDRRCGRARRRPAGGDVARRRLLDEPGRPATVRLRVGPIPNASPRSWRRPARRPC